MTTAEACERLFTLMDIQPSKVRPLDHAEAYRQMWAPHYGLIDDEDPPDRPRIDGTPVPPPLHPQTSDTSTRAI